MASQRINQVNELIKREITKIIAKEIELPPKSLVTLVKVETSKDLSVARAWISIFPSELQGGVMIMLKKNLKLIQRGLNSKLIMKFVPKIDFLLDTTEDKVEHLNHLLDSLKKE